MDCINRLKDSNGEIKSQDRKQRQGEQNANWPSKAKRAIGIAFAGMLIAAEGHGVEARSLGSEPSGLIPRESNSHRSLMEGYAPQSFQKLDIQKFEKMIKHEIEAFSPQKSPMVEQIWPNLYNEMVKGSGKQGDASKDLHQGEVQRRDDGRTSLDFHSKTKGLLA